MAIGAAHGYYPISFAYLRDQRGPLKKTHWISDVVPGRPYAFDSEDDYRDQYRQSVFGLTHKKAGWDCHRHLEILFAGCIPYMPDVHAIPHGTMHFYPKSLMFEVLDLTMRGSEIPVGEVLDRLHVWSHALLRPEAMVRYVEHVCGDLGRVLYVDPQLDTGPDYLSMQLLGGLVKRPGTELNLFALPEYLWSEPAGASALYGRGFGYVGSLVGRSRPTVHSVREALSDEEFIEEILRICAAQDVEAVIFASVHRSLRLANLWIERNGSFSSPVRTLLIDGGDYPVHPQPKEIRAPWLWRFARELVVSS